MERAERRNWVITWPGIQVWIRSKSSSLDQTTNASLGLLFQSFIRTGNTSFRDICSIILDMVYGAHSYTKLTIDDSNFWIENKSSTI